MHHLKPFDAHVNAKSVSLAARRDETAPFSTRRFPSRRFDADRYVCASSLRNRSKPHTREKSRQAFFTNHLEVVIEGGSTRDELVQDVEVSFALPPPPPKESERKEETKNTPTPIVVRKFGADRNVRVATAVCRSSK